MARFIPALILSAAAWAGAPTAISAAVPAAPVSAFPADKAKNISVYTNLKWKKTMGATAYHVQLATDSGFTAPVFEDSTLVDTLVQMRKIADSTLFYWRVRAGNASGFGPYSRIRSFTTQPPLGEGPATVAPENYALGVALAPTLVWNAFAGAESYWIQVSLTGNFSAILFEDTGVADTTRKLSGLEKGTTYYWHVRANTTPVKTGWTKAAFTTQTDPPSDAAALLSPVDGAVNQTVPVDFSWSAVLRATGYVLQISDEEDFSTVFQTDSTQWSYATVDGLSLNTTYYWRVRGISGTGQGPWSATATVKTAGGTDGVIGMPQGSVGLRAFPAGPGRNLHVEFTLPARSRVRILAYGPLGGEAEVLTDGMMDTGRHRILAPSGRGAAGVRFIELRTQGARQVVRVVSP